MPTVTQEEAIANLPQLIDDMAEQGGEIVVTRGRIAIARIVPVVAATPDPPSQQRKLSREERVALWHQGPPVSEPGPPPTDESLRRENIYPDRT